MSGADNAGESLRGLRILLVEDDPLICLDLETSLEEFGAIVTAASNVAAAFAALAIAMPDFVVLDFELGAETSEPIAEVVQARSVPFLYLSGYSETDERFSRWPGVRVLVKPLSATRIARGIEDILKRR
jgi:CheY-like chemotaxis protein